MMRRASFVNVWPLMTGNRVLNNCCKLTADRVPSSNTPVAIPNTIVSSAVKSRICWKRRIENGLFTTSSANPAAAFFGVACLLNF